METTEDFTSTYDADSESAPNMTDVAGTYAGLRADNHTVTVTVATGTLSSSSDGCTVAGTLSPRAKGNVFHTSVAFGGGACSQGTKTVTGWPFTVAPHNGYTVPLSIMPGPTALYLSV